MKSKTKQKSRISVAARIAGEDLKPGDYITVLNEYIELPSFLWCSSTIPLEADEPVRYRYIPRSAGQPLEVIAVCLPFVYSNRPDGNLVSIDTRRQQLVRLDPKQGRKVWQRFKSKGVC